MTQDLDTENSDTPFPQVREKDFLHSGEVYEDQHAGITSINGEIHAVGLIWLTTDDDEKQSNIYKKINALDCDFFCFRNTIKSPMQLFVIVH